MVGSQIKIFWLLTSPIWDGWTEFPGRGATSAADIVPDDDAEPSTNQGWHASKGENSILFQAAISTANTAQEEEEEEEQDLEERGNRIMYLLSPTPIKQQSPISPRL